MAFLCPSLQEHLASTAYASEAKTSDFSKRRKKLATKLCHEIVTKTLRFSFDIWQKILVPKEHYNEQTKLCIRLGEKN
jgi:hypothetical protein